MKKIIKNIKPYFYIGVTVLVLTASMQQNAWALDPIKIGDVDAGVITGFVRVGASWNLQDHPEPDRFGKKIGGKGDLSMLRETLQLQYVKTNLPYDASFTMIGQLIKESRTSYLNRLDANPFQTGNLMDNYNSNANAFREAYIDVPLSDNIQLRFGKQIVAWGETDLVQAMDIINPRDLSWSPPGFDPEDEDLRRALIMANLTISVPEANGALQLLYRPGWDRESQLASKLDLFGGRLAGQPFKGINLLSGPPFGLSYNYHHPHGDTDDPSYGFRWTGVMGESSIGYSLAYYHSVESFPILNASIPGIVTPYKGKIGVPGGVGAEFILPEFDLIGGSVNVYLPGPDLVLRSEFSFTKDKVYNAQNPLAAFFPPTTLEQDTVRVMLGFDKQLSSMIKAWGTDAAPFWTVQLFDSWIPSFNKNDKILNNGGPAYQKEHSFTFVSSLGLSYKHNKVQPNIALAVDTTYGSAVLIPTLTLVYGDHWRVLLSSFFAFPDVLGGKSATPTNSTSKGAFAGYDNNNQVGARVTYQF